MSIKQKQRLLWVFALTAIIAVGAFLLISAVRANTQFFHSPSAVAQEGFIPKSETFRVGGFVVPDSVVRKSGLEVSFDVRDFEATPEDPNLTVEYIGELPDLFREGEGVVVAGKLNDKGIFIADEVLAKHDNEYVPALPENKT